MFEDEVDHDDAVVDDEDEDVKDNCDEGDYESDGDEGDEGDEEEDEEDEEKEEEEEGRRRKKKKKCKTAPRVLCYAFRQKEHDNAKLPHVCHVSHGKLKPTSPMAKQNCCPFLRPWAPVKAWNMVKSQMA